MTIFRPAVITKIDGQHNWIAKQKKLITVQMFEITGSTSFSSDNVAPIFNFFGSPPLGIIILANLCIEHKVGGGIYLYKLDNLPTVPGSNVQKFDFKQGIKPSNVKK